VSNVVVDPGLTLITFDLTLAGTRRPRRAPVIVVTESGTARCNIASNPPAPPLVAAKLVKTGRPVHGREHAFRLFVFEFLDQRRVRERAPHGRDLRADGLAHARPPDTAAIEQAFRDAHRGSVRVRAVTATKPHRVSPAQSIRR
jgi:hypothetical protein